MKQTKSYSLLCLYDSLMNGGSVERIAYCQENAISSRTFSRYMSEIRCILTECHNEKELVVDNENHSYHIRKVVI